MNVNEAIRELRKREKQLEKAFKDTLPRKIGAKAVNLVNRNFREGGFYDDGLHPWKGQSGRIQPKAKRRSILRCLAGVTIFHEVPNMSMNRTRRSFSIRSNMPEYIMKEAVLPPIRK